MNRANIDVFKIVAIGEEYTIYAYEDRGTMEYECHNKLFQKFFISQILIDDLPVWAEDGEKVTELSQALGEAIEGHYA